MRFTDLRLVGCLTLLLGCGASTPRSAAPAAAPSPPRPPAAAPSEAEVAVRVLTSSTWLSHGSMTTGTWYRRAGATWESASCSTNQVTAVGSIHDPVESPPPQCSAWARVPAEQMPAVERAAEQGRVVHCSHHAALCADLGLTARS